ncbi:hypothetical protein K502DRAFT_362983 [Neoconidiobolus thromboides FSU 785]|nr:hypothetical protein K502DRAFT_362983 [Neoconidiobolus thromboides FSU 785]
MSQSTHKHSICLLMGNSHLGLKFIDLLTKKHTNEYEELLVGVYEIKDEFKKHLKDKKIKLIEINDKEQKELKEHLNQKQHIVLIPPKKHDQSLLYSTLKLLDEIQPHYLGMVSWIGAKHSEGKMMSQMYAIEKCITAIKSKYRCILHCDLFQDELKLQAPAMQDKGKMVFSFGDKKFAPVYSQDIAIALIKLLMSKTEELVEGEVHYKQFNGPKKLNGKELVEIASTVLDMDYEYKKADRKETKKVLMMNEHVSEDKIDLLLDYYDLVAKGYAENPSDDLKKVLNIDPTPVDVFIQGHSNYFKPRS